MVVRFDADKEYTFRQLVDATPMSHRELAGLFGACGDPVSAGTIGKWYRGETIPSMKHVNTFERVFPGVDIHKIIWDKAQAGKTKKERVMAYAQQIVDGWSPEDVKTGS